MVSIWLLAVAECGWWSFAIFGASGSLEITASRWQSFRVDDSFFMVANSPSVSFQKFLLLAPDSVVQGRWRPKVFFLFPYGTNETTRSLAVFQGRSRSLR